MKFLDTPAKKNRRLVHLPMGEWTLSLLIFNVIRLDLILPVAKVVDPYCCCAIV